MMLDEVNVREFVQRGIEKPLIFPINENLGIKFRPLGDLEIHEAYNKPLNRINDAYTLQAFLIARNNGEIDLEFSDVKKIDMQLLCDCMDEVKAWLIYFATRDFQDEDYSIEDIKKLKDIWIFSNIILHVSGHSGEAMRIIKEFSESEEGKNLRFFLEQSKCKIVSDFNEITKTQMDFLYFTSPEYQRRKMLEEMENAPNASVLNFKNPDKTKEQFEVLWKSLQPTPPEPEPID